MLTSDDELAEGEVLEIVLTRGDETPVTLRLTSRSYPSVQAAWKQFEFERGERITMQQLFELLGEGAGHAARRPRCGECGGPCLD